MKADKKRQLKNEKRSWNCLLKSSREFLKSSRDNKVRKSSKRVLMSNVVSQSSSEDHSMLTSSVLPISSVSLWSHRLQ